jgi:hypothetical protein
MEAGKFTKPSSASFGSSLLRFCKGSIAALKLALREVKPGPVASLLKLFVLLGLIVLGITIAWYMSRTVAKPAPLRIVVLTSWFTNNEQFVTFRAEPRNAEITIVDMVPGSYDDRSQPATIRAFGEILPAQTSGETNPLLHFVALPIRGASFGGTPVAYTPGSYTVAYTPTKKVHRIRTGIAFQENGIADYFLRIRNCWYQNSLGPLRMKSHQDAVFVTSGPITNMGKSQ